MNKLFWILRPAGWTAIYLCAGWFCSGPAHADELAEVERQATAAREAAAAHPRIDNVDSPSVTAYLAEQRRRRLVSVAGLRERIAAAVADPAKQNLVPILKQQLADLLARPLEAVSFDAAYGYPPTTGLVGYSKRVRLLENTADGRSIIQVENIPLVVPGMETSQYPSGKFLPVQQALLIGAAIPEQTVQGVKKMAFHATLVDLEKILESEPSKP